MMQLSSTIMSVLFIVALLTGLISGTCFYMYYIKKEKKNDTLYKLSIGFFAVFLIACIGIWKLSVAGQEVTDLFYKILK